MNERAQTAADLDQRSRELEPQSNQFIGESSQNFEVSELSVDARIGIDLKDDKKLRVNLESEDDALFVGTLYVGAPHSQPVKVIFDTGSEHLAITSALCNNKSAGNYHIYKEDKFQKFLKLDYYAASNKTFDEKVKELETNEYLDTDEDWDEDLEGEENVQETIESTDDDSNNQGKHKKSSGKKHKKKRENRCRS